jgi:hypothetical protein
MVPIDDDSWFFVTDTVDRLFQGANCDQIKVLLQAAAAV